MQWVDTYFAPTTNINLFRKLKIMSQNQKCDTALRKIRIKLTKAEIYRWFGFLGIHPLFGNKCVSIRVFLTNPHISMQVEKYIGHKQSQI